MSGQKTYLVAVGSIIYGILGLLLESHDQTEAAKFVIGGIGAIFMRMGVKKAEL